MGIALMALNMWKLSTSGSKISPANQYKKKTTRISQKIRVVFFKDRDLCHSLLVVHTALTAFLFIDLTMFDTVTKVNDHSDRKPDERSSPSF